MLPEEKHKDHWKPEIEFESELQKKLRDSSELTSYFIIRMATNLSDTLIDHKTGAVYKGSEIMKMGSLFEFTSASMDKRLFEQLKDYGIPNAETKNVLLKYLKATYPENELSDYMLFDKKLKNKEIFNRIRNDVKQYLKTQYKYDVSPVRSEGRKIYYAVHSKASFYWRTAIADWRTTVSKVS
jgi:hypothetical protein